MLVLKRKTGFYYLQQHHTNHFLFTDPGLLTFFGNHLNNLEQNKPDVT